jgi:hypothetical protein
MVEVNDWSELGGEDAQGVEDLGSTYVSVSTQNLLQIGRHHLTFLHFQHFVLQNVPTVVYLFEFLYQQSQSVPCIRW